MYDVSLMEKLKRRALRSMHDNNNQSLFNNGKYKNLESLKQVQVGCKSNPRTNAYYIDPYFLVQRNAYVPICRVPGPPKQPNSKTKNQPKEWLLCETTSANSVGNISTNKQEEDDKIKAFVDASPLEWIRVLQQGFDTRSG